MGFGVTLLCCDLFGGKLAGDAKLQVWSMQLGCRETNVARSGACLSNSDSRSTKAYMFPGVFGQGPMEVFKGFSKPPGSGPVFCNTPDGIDNVRRFRRRFPARDHRKSDAGEAP